MRLLPLAVILLTLLTLASAHAADQIVVAWEFNRDGDAEKWYPAHALAPLEVAGGILKTRATAGDPYMISSEDNTFDVAANDFQYIETRLKCDKEGGAEFFWANTTEGRDMGFAAGKERGFSVKGDQQFHVYRVFPVWQGRITRLRLDPAEESAIEVDYIRIMQAPVTKHDPGSPRWDFAAEGAGGFLPMSGARLDTEATGIKATLEAVDASLTGPPVDLQAGDYVYATLHLTTTDPAQAVLHWSDTTDGSFAGCNAIPFDIGAGEDYVGLHLAESPMWTGAIRRLRLDIAGQEGDAVTLHSLALGKTPEGPAKLTILALAAERGIYATGETIRLTLRVRNDGGETSRSARTELRIEGDAVEVGEGGATEIPRLSSGSTSEISWTLRAANPGLAPASVRIAPEGTLRAAEARTELIVTEPIPALAAANGPFATMRGLAGVIGNEKLRLTLLPAGGGRFGGARVDLREGSRFRTMGCLPYLARLAIGDEEDPVAIPMAPGGAGGDGQQAWLKLSGSRQGVNVSVAYSAKAGQPWVDVSYRVVATKPVALRAFQGPWLWAGEGAFADEQDHAIFPGLEWLVRGERSSSSLDVAPPRHVRWAPHPNWITIPSMAIEQDRAIVGLMWDPLQKWDGKHTRPAAAFASPNFVEQRRNHLLGLYLPSIPDYVEPNALLAKSPYPLQPGTALTLQASIYVQARSEITSAATMWYDRFCPPTGGVPAPPLPPKPRDYAATVDMCLRSYETVLWKPDVKAWMPVVGWAPGRDAGTASFYYTAAQVRKEAPEAAAWREKALDVAHNSGDLTFALRGCGVPSASLDAVLSRGRAAAESQPEGARYGFQPDEQRKVLGPQGGIAVGIAAAPVEQLLSAAIRTGDKVPLEAGLKGLAFMDQFDVPRASQVWECPLHEPDILASGQACRAYLLGYRLTGDEGYLRRAIFWARTGLPFVYAWQDPEMPQLMKYASIPVFGTSFYTGLWFGVPVQWNGLDYANACLALAPYDASFPWRQIGEGITISGMNQQSTRAKDYGAYTDNWNLVTNVECVGCMLSPGGILGNVFTMLGHPAQAGVDGVVTPGGWIAVNGPGAVSGATLEDGVLTVQASYAAGETGCVAVMPIAKPASVSADGKALALVQAGQPEVGQWTYNPRLCCVTARLAFGGKPARIALSGVARAELGYAEADWRFDTPDDPQGWTAANDLSQPVVADGVLKMDITGADPYFVSPEVSVPADKATGIALRARTSKPGGGFFWGTDSGPVGPAREVQFALPADGQFHDAFVDVTKHPEWKGVIRQIRVDFVGGKGDTVEIEWVRVVRR